MTTKRWVVILFVLALVPRLLAAVIFGNTVLFPDELPLDSISCFVSVVYVVRFGSGIDFA